MRLRQNAYIISITLLFIASIVLNQTIRAHPLSIVTMSALTLIAGHSIFKKALTDLRYGIVGIDLLVTIAVVAAFFIGDYFEAAAVTYLFMLGHFLEQRSLRKTRSALKALMDLRPVMARVERDDEQIMLRAEEVRKGDTIIVKPGEKIPVDGTITEGRTSIDEQTLTGESMPADKTKGDEVYASTVLHSGYIRMQAEHVGEDTTFSKIIRMVEDAQDNKAPSQKLIESFSKYYTPSVVLLALTLFIFTQDIRIAITMLVIACPGALVISTPVSFVAGIGNAAKKGILFKGGETVESLSKGNVVLFDKTGTLTEGKPRVSEVRALATDEATLLTIAKAGEAYSEHPIAQAILEEAEKRNLKTDLKAKDIVMTVGKGVTFTYNGVEYRLGNEKLTQGTLDGASTESLHAMEEAGMTTLVLADSEKALGLIGISDTVREEARGLAHKLKALGIKRTVMLTGDRERVARSVSESLGIDDFHAGLLPEDKAEIIKSYKGAGHHTIFVGDGINDAPALTNADASVALGGLGKDIAMDTADTVLMSERLSKLTDAIRISRKVRANMFENIAFAMGVVLFLIIGVLFRQVTMSIGMLVHELSVLAVIINAIRLMRYEMGNQDEKPERPQKLHRQRPDIQEPEHG